MPNGGDDWQRGKEAIAAGKANKAEKK